MKNILVIDDQIDIQEILADFLRNSGYVVEACSNGFHAAQKVKEKQFSLIITDLMMPKGDGFSFIASTNGRLNTPVLIMTGGSNFEKYGETIKTLQKAGYIVLKKPFSKDELEETVKKLIKD